MVGRPRNIPERGDVAPKAIAQRLDVTLSDFERMRPELERRGFPPADPTTGNYCIEAVDTWRLRRFPTLFAGTPAGAAVNAGEVYSEKRRQVFGKN